MIKTFKVKHNRDFTKELALSLKVAKYAIANRDKLSTKYVKHLGLKAVVSCYVMRKYGRNWRSTKISRIKFGVASAFIFKQGDQLYIPCLKLRLDISNLQDFKKWSAVEFDDTYAYIPIEVKEKKPYKPRGVLGVDRNTTKHALVAADLRSYKVLMLGKSAGYTALKYNRMRRKLQKLGKNRAVKSIKNRQARKVRDLNHKISRKLVDYAYENKLEIKMENLKGIGGRKVTKSFRYALTSWPFFQLQTFVEYKAKEQGITVSYVAPQYTSKTCSRCGLLGTRTGKVFKCPIGHVAHADINAAYNIGSRAVGDYIKK